MLRYSVKRILSAVPVLLGISLLAFILGVLSPGDPAEFALNQDGLSDPTEGQIAAMRREMGLDRPMWQQYLSWLAAVLHGNLGQSFINGRDIAQEIWLRLPATAAIAVTALVIAAAGGILLGTACALKHGKPLDNIIKNLTNIMLAVPGFWLSLLLILIFCETLQLLPTSGMDSWKSLVLPALALSFSTMATVCRYMRGALLEEFGRQYFLTARVRGISRIRLLLFYALPNAIVPVIAILGNYFAGVLGGSVIAESIFAIPGISSMALEAIRFRDYPVLQAYVLVTGTVLVLVTVAVDLFIAFLNPKIKLGGR